MTKQGASWASSSTNSLPPASSTSSRCWPWGSKGVVACMAVQDWSQVEKVYGDKTAQAFSGLVGTHRVSAPGGRDPGKISRNLGKRTVAGPTTKSNRPRGRKPLFRRGAH